MKAIKTFFALILPTVLMLGCETESAEDYNSETNSTGKITIEVTDGSTTLSTNETVTLKASGGLNYSWSLSNDSYGNLSQENGSKVKYTAKETNVTQTIKVSDPTSSNLNATGSIKITQE